MTLRKYRKVIASSKKEVRGIVAFGSASDPVRLVLKVGIAGIFFDTAVTRAQFPG
jgi:hypothetical protein